MCRSKSIQCSTAAQPGPSSCLATKYHGPEWQSASFCAQHSAENWLPCISSGSNRPQRLRGWQALGFFVWQDILGEQHGQLCPTTELQSFNFAAVAAERKHSRRKHVCWKGRKLAQGRKLREIGTPLYVNTKDSRVYILYSTAPIIFFLLLGTNLFFCSIGKLWTIVTLTMLTYMVNGFKTALLFMLTGNCWLNCGDLKHVNFLFFAWQNFYFFMLKLANCWLAPYVLTDCGRTIKWNLRCVHRWLPYESQTVLKDQIINIPGRMYVPHFCAIALVPKSHKVTMSWGFVERQHIYFYDQSCSL